MPSTTTGTNFTYFTCFTSTKAQILTGEEGQASDTAGGDRGGAQGGVRRRQPRLRHPSLLPGTHFTCFISTKVQMLTGGLVCQPFVGRVGQLVEKGSDGTHFTCFTSTKVQTLTAAAVRDRGGGLACVFPWPRHHSVFLNGRIRGAVSPRIRLLSPRIRLPLCLLLPLAAPAPAPAPARSPGARYCRPTHPFGPRKYRIFPKSPRVSRRRRRAGGGRGGSRWCGAGLGGGAAAAVSLAAALYPPWAAGRFGSFRPHSLVA